MTTKARLVLRDCEAALEDLRAGPTGLQWRTRWAAAAALLRSVGHVLEKVDARSSTAMAEAVKEEFRALKATKPHPQIFWEFIEEERNNILKEYRSSAKQNVTIFPGTIGLNLKTGEEFEVAPSRPTLFEHVMSDGPFAGQDPRDVVQLAIDWWRDYLDRIDRRASECEAV